ncbi:acetyltransferase [Paenibacillus sp. LHD-38]|uniref:acetyltransferase n=1 Tax=Paenibacillus sp. LHD-38 TaxID=3072143 RepID=UPI00280DB926|nr:acetyltransferase [Paenibacillus sp. LHD-38]MDQ8735755.1 acetyltransferase [Paenibacillus sp. LHD-38]
MKSLVIVGMGGHSKVAADVALRLGYKIIGYVDDTPRLGNSSYICTPNDFIKRVDYHNHEVFIAIGNNKSREDMVSQFNAISIRYATLIDPSAITSPLVEIKEGSLVMPGSVINTHSKIGSHSIINTSSSVDHDCFIEDFVHLSPGVHLAGGVTVKKGAHLGIGCVVIPSITIGEKSVVGAGAVVVKDVPANVTVVGVPAQIIKSHK